jgi:HK97 family phage prohead protease
MNKNKEYRSADIAACREFKEQDEEKQLIVEGYAAVIEQPTVICDIDGVKYCEIIDKDAFVGADMSNVPMKYNHSNDFLVLARTRNKTLQLEVDSIGLKVRANLANTTAGQDLYTLIERGDIDKMSFGFTVTKDSYDAITHTRRILQFGKIWDVSAVDTPAYDGTSISARDYFSAQAEMQKRAEQEEQRKRLYLMTF